MSREHFASSVSQSQLSTLPMTSIPPPVLSLTSDTLQVSDTDVMDKAMSPDDSVVVLSTPSKKQRDITTVTPSYSTNRKSRPSLTVVTPLSSKSKCCGDCNVCAVCLSPMLSSSRSSKLIVETRCKHLFHDSCLQLTKQRKAVCPCCRGPVTPLTSTQRVELDDSYIPPLQGERPPLQPGSNHTSQSYLIASAAGRVREALRYRSHPTFIILLLASLPTFPSHIPFRRFPSNILLRFSSHILLRFSSHNHPLIDSFLHLH